MIETRTELKHSVSITIDGLPSSLNSRFKHWSVKAKDTEKWREIAKILAQANRPPRPMINVELHCVRYSSVESDYDNLVSTFKPIIDGIKDAGVIWDDGPKIIVKREYRHEKVPPRSGYVRVLVLGDIMTEDQIRKENEIMTKKTAKKSAKKSAPKSKSKAKKK